MKKNKLFFGLIAVAIAFASCAPSEDKIESVVDFEDVTLGDTGYWTGTDSTTNFVSGDVTFNNSYMELSYGDFSYVVWSGFACSQKTDTVTEGYTNQYSVMAGSGATNSSKFGLVYGSGTSFVCPANSNGNYSIESIMLTNSTYAYLDMKNGSSYSKKFSTDDWFKVTIKGYLNKTATDSVDVYLADFRDGRSEILKTWKTVDLSKLGAVDSVSFSFSSTDNGDFGMNTPAYVCVDNIKLTQTATVNDK